MANITKRELTNIVETIIKKELSTFIKPTIQKVVLEELSLVLGPAIKKIINEVQGERNMQLESEIPVSEYRKNLFKNIGLSQGSPKILNSIPQYNQNIPTRQTGVGGVLAETLNDIIPGELNQLGVGEDYSLNSGMGMGQMMNPGMLNDAYQDYSDFNPNPVNINMPSVNSGNPLAKLEESFSKDYSKFLGEMEEHANNTRGAHKARAMMQEEVAKQKLGKIIKS